MADLEFRGVRTDKSQSFADKVMAVEKLLAEDAEAGGGANGKDKVA